MTAPTTPTRAPNHGKERDVEIPATPASDSPTGISAPTTAAAPRPVPVAALSRLYPDVAPESWEWRTRPRRLCAPYRHEDWRHRDGNWVVVVVTDEDGAHAFGQVIDTDLGDMHEFLLTEDLYRRQALSQHRQIACRDGLPVLHTHGRGRGRCVWCGGVADTHQAPAQPPGWFDTGEVGPDGYPTAPDFTHDGREVWDLHETEAMLATGHGPAAITAMRAYLDSGRHLYLPAAEETAEEVLAAARITEVWTVFHTTCGCTPTEHDTHSRPEPGQGCGCQRPGLPPCQSPGSDHSFSWVAIDVDDPETAGAVPVTLARW